MCRGSPERGPGGPGRVQGRTHSFFQRFGGSYIQDFVQEVLVGQMAQGTRGPPPPRNFKVRRGRGRLNLPTVSNTPPKARRIYSV